MIRSLHRLRTDMRRVYTSGSRETDRWERHRWVFVTCDTDAARVAARGRTQQRRAGVLPIARLRQSQPIARYIALQAIGTSPETL